MSLEQEQGKSLGNRFIEEMRSYIFISLYLWVCFSALILYESALRHSENLPLLPFSTAVVKALIIGKFILIGKAMIAGSKINPDVLFHRILSKSLASLFLLLIFSALEALIVGQLHGHTVAEVTARFADQSWLQSLAPSMVMLLILIPLISFEEIDRVLGEGSLKRLLFGRPGDE